MHLSLSTEERRNLAAASTALLSPLEYDDADAWRAAVLRAVTRLLDADKGVFVMPVQGNASVYSDHVPPTRIGRYAEKVAPIASDVPLWQRTAALQVHDARMVWRDWYDAYLRSAYYNEFMRPLRLHNATGMTLLCDGVPRFDNLAQLVVHHDASEAPPFGERGLALFHLLYPALQAGVHAFRRHAAHRESFVRFVDASGEPLELRLPDGVVVHRTPALSKALHDDPERDVLAAEMGRCARTLTTLRRAPAGPVDALAGAPASREVTTVAARYRVRASYLDAPVGAGRRHVMVALERLTTEPPSVASLCDRFGLTPRQAQVALLLAKRLSNREVAERLAVSPHTARHHAQAVLDKLGVHSRTEVRAAIM